jgi:hypothetical protein
MLAADFDGILSVDEAVERFDGFAYWLYTSYNHLTVCEKTGRIFEKFRMFFPFVNPCPIREFETRKRAFLRFLNTDDESCVASSRGFYMPSCPAERMPVSRSWFQDGVWLDWGTFEPEIIPEFRPVNRLPSLGSSFFCVHSFWKKLRAGFSPMRRRALCGAEGRIRHDRTWTA